MKLDLTGLMEITTREWWMVRTSNVWPPAPHPIVHYSRDPKTGKLVRDEN